MADIQPFPALRPKPDLASKICELPYDVMSSDEARAMSQENPLSFLHVSKPEIDLDPKINLYDPKVYAKGRENLQSLIKQRNLIQDDSPSYYLYRQVMGSHTQIGLVAAASCLDYEKNVIKKHELTRPDKEDDRVRHIETLNSQTGPVFLTYKATKSMDDFVAKKSQTNPSIDFTAKDGVRHTSWLIDSKEDIAFIQNEFLKIESLYVADGHHRSAAAVRVWNSRGKKENSSKYFLSVIFPHNQMQIMPYNRVVKDLNGRDEKSFLEELKKLGSIEPSGSSKPDKKHEISIYLGGKWSTFRWNGVLVQKENAIGQLDVSLLQKHVLDPLLGITDPRTSNRINFVGGIRGTDELEKLVNSKSYVVAFSMYPTKIEDLMTISDEGGLMPPKSTWFEPKLRDAMFCHMIE